MGCARGTGWGFLFMVQDVGFVAVWMIGIFDYGGELDMRVIAWFVHSCVMAAICNQS